jgi:hypothetical protein
MKRASGAKRRQLLTEVRINAVARLAHLATLAARASASYSLAPQENIGLRNEARLLVFATNRQRSRPLEFRNQRKDWLPLVEDDLAEVLEHLGEVGGDFVVDGHAHP